MFLGTCGVKCTGKYQPVIDGSAKIYVCPVDPYPKQSMYGTFTYIRLICMVNVGKYTILYMDPMGMGYYW